MSDLQNSEEDLISTINNITEALQGLGFDVDALRQSAQANLTDEQRQALIDKQTKKEMQEWNEKVAGGMSKATNAALGFASSVKASPGNFTSLNKVVDLTNKAFGALVGKVPFVGGALKGLGEAAAETAKFMIDSFQQAYGTFEKLSETGIVTSFESMTASANAMGLTFADTEQVLSKASKDLAMLGGSAIRGRQEFEKLAVSSEQTRRDFQKLGISAADFSEFQLSYVAQQQRYNKGQTKSVEQLKEGSEAYIKELDALSKLTGVSRKQLQQEQEARMRDARYRAGIASLREDERKEINSFLGVLKSVAPDIEEGMKDLIASGGVPVTEAGKAAMLALQQGGLNVQEVVEGLRSGSMKGFAAFEKVAGAAGKAADSTEHLAKITGDGTIITKQFVSLRELEARRSQMTQEEYDKLREEIEKNISATTGQNANLADAKTAMYNAGRNIEQLATSSEIATKAISLMGDGVEFITEKMYELAGKELPEHLKARKEERKAIEADKKAKEELAKKDAKYQESLKARDVYLEADKKYLEKQEEIDKLKIQYSQSSSVEEKAELDKKIKAAQQESATIKKQADDARRIYSQKNAIENQKKDAEKKAAETDKKREDARQKRIEKDKEAGAPIRPEDKKALEDKVKPKEILESEAKISQLEKETKLINAVLLEDEQKLTDAKKKQKELKDKIEKEKDELKKQEYRNELATVEKSLTDMRAKDSEYNKNVNKLKDKNKELQEEKEKRAKIQIRIEAQEAQKELDKSKKPAPAPAAPEAAPKPESAKGSPTASKPEAEPAPAAAPAPTPPRKGTIRPGVVQGMTDEDAKRASGKMDQSSAAPSPAAAAPAPSPAAAAPAPSPAAAAPAPSPAAAAPAPSPAKPAPSPSPAAAASAPSPAKPAPSPSPAAAASAPSPAKPEPSAAPTPAKPAPAPGPSPAPAPARPASSSQSNRKKANDEEKQRVSEFKKELESLGITNKFAQDAITLVSAKESNLGGATVESGVDKWINTVNNLKPTYTYAKGTSREKSGLTGPEYMREAIPQLKTLNNGIYNDNQKLKELIQSGDEKFFDTVYGHLGGYKYRGRGYIQITGKANYENVGKIIGEDLVKDPDLILKDKKIAAKAAAAYLMNSFGAKSGGPSKGLEILNSFQNKEDALNFVTLNVHRGGAGLNKDLLEREKKQAAFNQQVAKAQEKEYLIGQEELPKAAKGGLFSGPASGYPVMLHGDEAVVPLEGSATKKDLSSFILETTRNIAGPSQYETSKTKNTKDIELPAVSEPIENLITTNYQQFQQSNQQTIDKFDQMLKAFQDMTDKLSNAVELLEDSKRIQNGLLSNSIN